MIRCLKRPTNTISSVWAVAPESKCSTISTDRLILGYPSSSIRSSRMCPPVLTCKIPFGSGPTTDASPSGSGPIFKIMKRATTNLLKIVLVGIVAGFTFSSTAQAWWNNEWTIRKKIIIDTSAAGGAISDPIGTTPVLIRLADLDFGAAKDDGSDIRLIAGDDKTPLAFHLEKFDSLLGEAFIWVKVSDLKPGAQATIWLYYGNQGNITVPGGGDPKETYDSDTVLVYHFAESGAPAHDSSGQGDDSQGPIATTDSLIGPGLRLGGKLP